jgi:hypothetical protein
MRNQPHSGIQLQAIAKWAVVSVLIILVACYLKGHQLWIEAVFSRVINREDPFHGGYVSLLVQRARNGWSLPAGTTPEDLLRALNGRMVVDLRSQHQEDDGERRLPSTETPSSEVATVEATSAWLRARLPPFRSGRVVYSAMTSVSRMELSLLEQSQVGTISTHDLAAFVFVWETEPELCVDEPGGEPDKHRAFIRHRYGDAVHVVFLCWWDGVYTNQDWSRQGMQALDRALLIQRRPELT